MMVRHQEECGEVSWRYHLKKYSTRAWAYRQDQAWVFDELTPDELAIFRADQPPRIETVRIPEVTAIITSGKDTDGMERWFLFCTLEEPHPQAFARFRFFQVGKDCISDEYSSRYPIYDINDPLEIYDWIRDRFDCHLHPGLYVSWLWNDQIEVCRTLGCDIVVGHGYGWDKLTPPTR
jgi:hypothetical protein